MFTIWGIRLALEFGMWPGNDYYDEFGTNWVTWQDPLLGDPTILDFTLGSGSPAIDTGTNTLAPIADFEGIGRPVDGDMDTNAITDIGAIEYQP